MKVDASSGRAHVPPAALLLIDLVNSAEPQEGTDTWDSPEGLRAWLLRHDLLAPADRVTAADLHRLLDLREGFRAVLAAHTPAPVDADPGEPADSVDPAAVARLNAALAEVSLRVRFEDDGAYRLASPAAGVNGAVGRVLDAVRSATEDGSWIRVKVCARHSCRWAFYDGSRNRSARWCSMAGCGNTVKMRRAYATRRDADRSKAQP